MQTYRRLPGIAVRDTNPLETKKPKKLKQPPSKFHPAKGPMKHDLVALALEVIRAGSWVGIGEANGYKNQHQFKQTILRSSRVVVALSPQQIAALEKLSGCEV